ncbi:MAG: TrkH family potassium uptake protein [Bacillota bacterium]
MGVMRQSRFWWRWSPVQVLAASFALLILLGSLLLAMPAASRQGQLNYLDALFTATSAVCVNGLVVVDTWTQFSFWGQLVLLSLIQIGGLGVMTLATLLVVALGRRVSLRNRLLMQEALNQGSLEGIIRLLKSVGLFTFFFEALGALILTICFLPDYGWPLALWKGAFHSVSAFCNAGFDLIGQWRNLAPYASHWGVNLTITTLIIVGGLGFSVIADLQRQRREGFRWSRLTLHSKLVLTASAVLLLGGSLFILVAEWGGGLAGLPPVYRPLAAWFQSVATRTAGFSTIATSSLKPATLFVLILLMFIGASPGSTGGGVKTTTFAAVFLMVVAVIRGRDDANVFGRRIPRELVMRSMSIVAVSLALVIGVTIALSLLEDHPFLTLLFEATSAFATVGLSLGITPGLSLVSKLIVIFTMYAGRVGPMTLAVALAHTGQQAQLRYPEEKIIVG